MTKKRDAVEECRQERNPRERWLAGRGVQADSVGGLQARPGEL